MSNIRPDPSLPLAGKVFFWVFWIGCMALFTIFVLPLIYDYASVPLADWVTNLIFGPEPVAG